MFRKLLENHILTNLAFLLVLVMGGLAYYQMPREQDPSVNFHWIQIWTYWPGATASDVESRITEPLEVGIKKVSGIKFVSSTSREGVSSIIVRFKDLPDQEFAERISDLRRELQSRQDELPADTKQPEILEVSSANAFPTATLVVWSYSDGDNLQTVARNVKEDLERLGGVDDVATAGDRDPELLVNFVPARLLAVGVSPVALANTVSAYFKDLSAGDIAFGDQKWLIRLAGTSSSPEYIGTFPVLAAESEVPLRSLAEVERGRTDAQELVRYNGHPAVMLSVAKSEDASNLTILDEIRAYIGVRNRTVTKTGVELVLLDDQTRATRSAISVMERNALIGLVLVLLMSWLFLGFRISMFTSIGIPFTLAGTFWVLHALGQTLNVTVLLGVVISLGMLVDDAVVVVENIYVHLQRGKDGIRAAIDALQEVAIPVTTAVLTTIAAFLPLMLLPGLLGDFMRVVPIVVTVALLISLVEAFWILPGHVAEFQPDLRGGSRVQRFRTRVTWSLKRLFARQLIKVLRWPKLSLGAVAALLALVVAMLFHGHVRVDFFATDLYRLFYVNVDMPPGTSLEKSGRTLASVEALVRRNLRESEIQGIVSYAGQQFTETELLNGDEKAQVFVSLNPAEAGDRSVDQIIDSMRQAVLSVPGPTSITFLRRKTGPPTSRPISIKVRGDDIAEIRRVVRALSAVLQTMEGVSEISDDDTQGGMELTLRLNPDAIMRAGIDPNDVIRSLRLFGNGEIVASMQYQGEKLNVRVRAGGARLQDIDTFLKYPIGLPGGGGVPLGELLTHAEGETLSNIRHYDFRRAVTLEADLDSAVTDTLSANREIQRRWRALATDYPGISLDFSGELDDIQESLAAMSVLFMLGMGLIYLILGTQFKSYLQPLIILITVPMAFMGVVLGLFFSANPMSLFTMYGAIALAGIAANDAIVLLSLANRYLERGWPVATAVVHAARRRVLPILITSLTTMAGLFSLATGLGGESLMWGPVATAIVWGLGFSTLLTLFVIPLVYNLLSEPRESIQLLPAVPRVGGWRLSEILRHPLAWVRDKAKGDPYAQDYALRSALSDQAVRSQFEEGVAALRAETSEVAIRAFQQLANERSDVLLFNLYAAHANLQLMQRIGWDIGYMDRAKKYLGRAQSIDPEDPRLAMLRKAYARQDEEVED
ncbi:MAG: efflux RND transporter permease subunit [Gammaproteobacteria bacterium]|nr:efflux RND transporter permease subunit [Gammaproteobacteria bacterium]